MDVTSYLLGKKAGGGGGQPTLQEKEITITENGTTSVVADTGYDGLSEVEITTNVSGGGAEDYFNTTLNEEPISGRIGLCLLVKELPQSITINNNITKLDYFLQNCIYIKETPIMNTSNITSMKSAFQNCWVLETINPIDTSNVTNFQDFASGCTRLKNIPILNLSKATNLNGMFEMIASKQETLTDASIDNLLQSCMTVSSAYTGQKKLTVLDWYISMYSNFQTRVQNSQYYQDFLNAGWTIS